MKPTPSEKDSNFNQAQSSVSYTYPSDEIDLVQLIKKVWATRLVVMIAALLTACLYITFIAFDFAGKAGFVRYSQVFDLTFKGADKGEFPNGTPFLISEMVSPAVLSAVFREHHLDQQGLTLDRFRRSIAIEPYAPEAPFIKQRFESQLSSKLSPAEAAELQARMKAALESAQSGSVRIFMTFDGEGISKELAQQILLDIGQVWAENAIKNDGVLKLDIPVYTAKIFNEERFESLDYLIGIELLLDNIGLVEANIESLKAIPASANVVDPETGFSLEDLSKTISDVKEYDLRQLMDPVKELGLTRNQDVVELYYNRKLNEMSLEKSFWLQRAELAAQVMNRYSGGSGGLLSSHTASGVTPQLSDAFLDRLVALSKEGGEQEFRQKLTGQILEYQDKALTIEQRTEEIKLVLAALRSEGGSASQLRDVYLQRVQEALPNVLTKLRSYTGVVNRLHEQLSSDASASVSAIVVPQGGSFTVAEPSPVTKKNLQVLLALCLGSGILAMLVSLVRQAGVGSSYKSERDLSQKET